jgi:hypothetical protein
MIILPDTLTTPEIRVLQEFRRLNAETLSIEQIKAIKHPAGGGEQPAVSLAGKGYLTADAAGFTQTDKARAFLAIDAKPMFEEIGTGTASAAAASGSESEAEA